MDASAVNALLETAQYSQMTARESALAREWIRRHAAEYDSLEFNAAVGAGVELGPQFSAEIRRQAMLGTRKRADIIARRGDRATIVELKNTLNAEALTQLLAYSALFSVDHPGIAIEQLYAVGRQAIEGAPEILGARGVTVEIYGSTPLAAV